MGNPEYTGEESSARQAKRIGMVRVGVLVEGWTVPAWVALMLEKVYENPSFCVLALVLHERKHRTAGLKGIVPRCYRLIEKRIMPVGADAEKPVSIRTLFQQTKVFTVRCSGDTCPGLMLEELRTLVLDVWINASYTICRCGLASASRYGILTPFIGRPCEENSDVAGFWEVARGDPSTVSGVHLVRPNLTGATVYHSTALTDLISARRLSNGVFWKSASFIPRVLTRERIWKDQVEETGPHPLNGSSVRPGNIRASAALLRRASAYFSVKLHDLRSFEQWVLLLRRGDDFVPPLEGSIPCIPPSDRFWADPFVIAYGDRHYIFLEEFLYTLGRGHIAVMVVHPDGRWEKPIPVLSRSYHLSYPFLFRWKGELYMVPESGEQQRVELYHCREFPLRWEPAGLLLKGVQAYDTTLCEHEGRWWMFTNIVENRGGSEHDELFLFHADRPAPGVWQAHALNPVVSDVRRARPAGAICAHEGKLYRPAQNCSHRYGYGVGVYRIDELTPSVYREAAVAHISPEGSQFKGVHTLNRGDGLTVMDAIIRRKRWGREDNDDRATNVKDTGQILLPLS